MNSIAHLSAACALLFPCLLAQSATAQEVDFDRQVRPILANKCFRCHGPDVEARKANLRFDVQSVAFAKRGDNPPAIVAGDAKGSELVRRINHSDPDEQMPPRSFDKQLTADEKRLLTTWIEQGAKWAKHWAFVAPRPPQIPMLRDKVWPNNDIDRLVLARLEREGLRPSPAADRRTLIRRVSLDLTGLPPEPAEVTAFVTDASPDPYEKLVDRLLSSPHYGEHMARFWLEAARYGDTHGLHLDNYREMWLYRDWVVQAFGDNMRFDRFTVEQLAGDLLPGATLAQKIASGFNRCHVTTNEGGSIKEEVYVRNVVDRVSTMGTVFLGLTLGCAVCHDHKFDPITQKEFYQLFAFFNNLDADPMDGNTKTHAPTVRVPSAEQIEQLAALKEKRGAVETEIKAELAQVEYAESENGPETAADEGKRRTIVWIDDALPEGAVVEGDGLVWVESPRKFVHSGQRAMKRKSVGRQQHLFAKANSKLRVGVGDLLFAWVYIDPEDLPEAIMLQWNIDGGRNWHQRAYWGKDVIPFGKGNNKGHRRMGALPEAGKWVRLEIPAAKVGLRPGTAIHGIAFTQSGGTTYWDTIGVETATSQEPEDFVWIDDSVPNGAKTQGDGKTWQWVGPEPGHEVPVLYGSKSLRRSGKGLIQDHFTGASIPLTVQAGDRLFAHVFLDSDDPPKSVQLQFNDGNWSHRARWGAPAHGKNAKGGADFVAGPLPATGKWVRLEVSLDEVDLAPGRQIQGWAFTQVDGTVHWDKAGVRTWGPPSNLHLESLAAWELFANDDKSVPAAVKAAVRVPTEKRKASQQRLVLDHYLRHVHAGTRAILAPRVKRAADLDKKSAAVEQGVPTTLVMKERKKPRQAYFLSRGQYDHRRDKVRRALPTALPKMAANLPTNRLGLARWVTDPAQPLMARVTVNRFWQQFFGVGLVKTSEDFGNQGERPSHPLLLDLLATGFVANGWNVKALVKRIVMSNTYRQSSRVTPERLARDPDNRLLTRGPRFRLDAEILRDQALALSGLLVSKIGGPGVRPPQPDGLWHAVGYSRSNTARFKVDKGHENLHRRSLYTFWKRTSPPPQMEIFDAPSREVCRVRRERTNTPLQALLMLNDPQFIEAARYMAQRTLAEGGADDSTRLAWMFRLATGRHPKKGEHADMSAMLTGQRASFRKDPAAAKLLIAVGEAKPDPKLSAVELAAWTMAANLILNLDEVLTKN